MRSARASHNNIGGASILDYSPHHEPFQYYPQTANPQHQPPTSIAMIGHQDQANHQYDLKDFFAAADHGDLPAVSYLKAAAYQDGHAGYSDPLDEQTFLASDDQPPREALELEQHRGHHPLRRLRRLV